MTGASPPGSLRLVQTSLHDHLPIRTYLQERLAAWRADWHAIDSFDGRLFSPAERELRTITLAELEALIAAAGSLLARNEGLLIHDRT